jgi:ABC-type multidrug transport system ATPase subunit
MHTIETQNLTRTFTGKDKRKIFAVKELNLRVAAGQIFGLLGPNGAGKTTLVRILTTILRPDSGTAKITDFCCAAGNGCGATPVRTR